MYIFKKANLYPILDLEFCKGNSIDPFHLIQTWKKFPKVILFFQLRAKNLSKIEYKELYESIKKKFPEERIIVNDFWEYGLSVNSFGIHLGKEDFLTLSESEKNTLRKNKNIIKGTSSHNLEDLNKLEMNLWDYTGFGPIFFTNSKKTDNPPLGVSALQEAIKQTKIQLVPIGGISEENIFPLLRFKEITPASISMMSNEKSILKIVDFISKITNPV